MSTIKDLIQGAQNNYNLHCGHTLQEHKMMEEAIASANLEGAMTTKTVCELIDLYKQQIG